jgi:hypothetical protein
VLCPAALQAVLLDPLTKGKEKTIVTIHQEFLGFHFIFTYRFKLYSGRNCSRAPLSSTTMFLPPTLLPVHSFPPI